MYLDLYTKNHTRHWIIVLIKPGLLYRKGHIFVVIGHDTI